MINEELLAVVLERLEPLPVTSRSMFGGRGLYFDGTFFGVIFDGVLYFRTDDDSRAEFTSRDMPALQPLPVSARNMFGGKGLYFDGTFFGFIFDGVLYFRTDDESRAEYTSRDMPALQRRGARLCARPARAARRPSTGTSRSRRTSSLTRRCCANGPYWRRRRGGSRGLPRALARCTMCSSC